MIRLIAALCLTVKVAVPAQAGLSDADALALAQWVLGGAK